MWHDSICNTVQEPTVTSIIVAMKTTTWGESGFPSEFLGRTGLIGSFRMKGVYVSLPSSSTEAGAVGLALNSRRMTIEWDMCLALCVSEAIRPSWACGYRLYLSCRHRCG